MIAKIKHLWREHKLLLVTFLIVSTFTLMFFARTIVGAAYFKAHADRPIEPWMPIGFIAKTYQVPPDILLDAANIPEGQSIRLQIKRVAQETGVPYEQLVAQFMDAIRKQRDMRPSP